MLTLVVILKGLSEIAGMLLLGQLAVGLLSGRRRHQNPIYQLFKISTQPVLRVTRQITPAMILTQHLPLVAGLWLTLIWLALTTIKIYLIQR